MSLEAYIWAGSLRLDEVDGTEFRVLLKYADRVDKYGRAAWFTAGDLADELGCSVRTVRRAIGGLVESGLMSRGDQRFVQHIPPNYRPVVYDLETPVKRMQDAVSGVTSETYLVTPGMSADVVRGDN